MRLTGAELLVKALQEEGVTTLFAYPGGQAIDLFDALYDVQGLEVVIPRHEQGLVHAADGYARSTGKVGVCLVTSGPGATNLVTGIATAHYDSVPLVCFTGQVPLPLLGKETFQEVDIVSITQSITKFAVIIRRREELGPMIQKAFQIARDGRPGAVVVDIPKDIQQALGSDDYPIEQEKNEAVDRPDIFAETLQKAADLLQQGQRPMILAGGGIKIAKAENELKALAEKTGIPVVTTIMGKGTLDTSHPLYVGNLGIHGSYAANMAISRCDVLLAVGTRFNDRITGSVENFAPEATIIHIDIQADVIGRTIRADVALVADAQTALAALRERIYPLTLGLWQAQIAAWHSEHPLGEPGPHTGELTPQAIIEAVNTLFDEVIVTTDVGQNQLWTTQFLALDERKQMLTSGGLGTMGYGFPAALGAKLGNPQTPVVAICGDGGFLMNSQELATAVVYELPVMICVLNNGYLGNVRQWQELFYHRHYAGTCTRYRKSCAAYCSAPTPNCPEYVPDFVRLAESYGAKGIRVQRPEEIRAAFLEAKRESQVPTLIEFIIGREENVLPIVPPGKALSEMTFGNKDENPQ